MSDGKCLVHKEVRVTEKHMFQLYTSNSFLNSMWLEKYGWRGDLSVIYEFM